MRLVLKVGYVLGVLGWGKSFREVQGGLPSWIYKLRRQVCFRPRLRWESLGGYKFKCNEEFCEGRIECDCSKNFRNGCMQD